MSEVSTRFTLVDEVSAKFTKMTSGAKKAADAFASAGKALDNAFRSSAASDFSGKAGQALKSVGNEIASMAGELEKAMSGLDGSFALDVGINDGATESLSGIEDALSELDGISAEAEVGADDSATPVISAAADETDIFDGMSAAAQLEVDDNATDAIETAKDEADNFDGMSAVGQLGADDNATPEIEKAKERLDDYDGSSGTSSTENDDNATPSIEAAREAGAEFDGSVWTATVSIVDTVTAPLTKIVELLKSPLSQTVSILGIGVGVSDVVNTYSDFEATMSEVKALADATDTEMEQLTAKAKEMGAVTKYSGTESAEAFTYMAQAGWTSQQMIDGIGGVMNLAASDGIELAEATDIVANALTAFGLEASDSAHFADVLAEAGAASNTNVSEMGEAFKYVSPVAGTLGYSIEDISLALGVMSNSGIKASQAGTTLRSALSNLSSPTDAQAEAMEKYGISLTDSEGNMKSFREVMDSVRSGLGDLSETEQAAAATTMFGDTAMSGMLAIVNASEESYNSLADAIDNSEGAAERMAETMQDNMAGALEQLGGAVETVELSWGERMEPYITGIANALQDAMPDIEEWGLGVFDSIDAAYEHLQNTIASMTGSDAWEDADFAGKVNIAWDELIGEPFTEWVSGDGKHLISDGITALLSEAGKILPGGETAGLTSWLSAGLLAKGTTSIISTAKNIASTLSPIASGIKSITAAAGEASSVGGFISTLGEMVPTAAKFGIAAAAITAAVVGITAAADSYNQAQIEENLDAHFGDISLDYSEAEALAGQIVPVDVTAQLNVANTEFDGADELIETAESLLAENDYINWKITTVNATLSEDDGETLLTNTQDFVTNVEEALEKEEYAAELTVMATLGENSNSDAIISQMQAWFAEDSAEVESLGNAVTSMLEDAINAGTYDVNTATAISILEGKMQDLVNGAQEAQLEGRLKWLTAENSGAALDQESWASVLSQASEYIEELSETSSESYASTFEQLEQYAWNDPTRRDSVDSIEKVLTQANAELNQSSQASLANWGYEGLQDAYGEELATAKSGFAEEAPAAVDYLQSELESALNAGGQVEPGIFLDTFETQLANLAYAGELDSSTRDALADRYEELLPTVDQLQESIDGYFDENGEQISAIPSYLMDSYNQLMEVGAAGGDENAIYSMLAQSLQDSGQLASFIRQAEEAGAVLPEEFLSAAKLAAAEVTDSSAGDLADELVTMLGSGDGIDWTAVNSLLEEYGYSISDALKEQGIDVEGEVPVNSGGLTVDEDSLIKGLEGLEATGGTKTYKYDGAEQTADEYKVLSGDSLSQIASEVGVELEELKAANQQLYDKYGTWDLIHPYNEETGEGDLVYIPHVSVDTGEAEGEINDALEGLSATGTAKTLDGGELAVEYEVTAAQTPEEIASEVGIAVDELLSANEGMEAEAAIEKGTKIYIPASAVEVDASGVGEAAEEAAQSEAGGETTADMTVTQNTTYVAGETDTSQLDTAAQEEVEEEPAEATVPTTITFEVSEINDEELSGAMTDYLKEQPAVPVTVPVDVTAERQNDNFAAISAEFQTACDTEVKSAFGDAFLPTANAEAQQGTDNFAVTAGSFASAFDSALKAAFKQTFTATADASITVNYSIANPTKTISFSGGGSGTATVYAHAEGGIFDTPHYGVFGESGAEAFIPIDGSQSAKEIWRETGERLGMFESAQPSAADVTSPAEAGTATVYAHAEGGYFTEPHLGVVAEAGIPEYVIPDDGGTENSVSLWQQAGESLGLLTEDSPLPVAPASADSGKNSNPSGSQTQASGSRTIDININGSGRITAGGGLSKEDVADVLLEKVRDVFVELVQEEALVGGDEEYEY